MDCLRNLITVEWCGRDNTLLPAPGQSLTINSLPGISFKQIVSITEQEQKNWKGVWDDVTLRASRRFELDFRQLMSRRAKLRTVTQAINIGNKIDTNTTTSIAATYRGIVLSLNYDNAQWVQSSMQQIQVDKLYFHNHGAGTSMAFKVFDLDTGSTIDDFTMAVNANDAWTVIDYRKRFNALFNATNFIPPTRIFIAYTATALACHKLDISNLYYNQYWDGKARVEGATTTAASPRTADLTLGNDTFGLSAAITVACTWENFVCQNRLLFETPFWYLCGIELLKEQIYSTRLNEFTTIGVAKAKELIVEYEAAYMMKDEKSQIMDGALKQAVDGVDIDLSDTCIECNTPVMIVENDMGSYGNMFQSN